MYTPQSLFDTVARHLLTQRAVSSRPAVRGNGCAYRGADGMKCAVGCLIPDGCYSEAFEGCGVYEPGETGDALRAAAGIPDEFHMIDLARCLQILHDDQRVEAWRGCLATIATEFKLDAACLEEFPA